MEGGERLCEDTCASVSVEIRPEHAGQPAYNTCHIVQDLNGETKKGVCSSHNSFCKSEAEKLQKERTPLLRSQSETRTKVEELLWCNCVAEFSHIDLKLA
jgi:hypothetical protein